MSGRRGGESRVSAVASCGRYASLLPLHDRTLRLCCPGKVAAPGRPHCPHRTLREMPFSLLVKRPRLPACLPARPRPAPPRPARTVTWKENDFRKSNRSPSPPAQCASWRERRAVRCWSGEPGQAEPEPAGAWSGARSRLEPSRDYDIGAGPSGAGRGGALGTLTMPREKGRVPCGLTRVGAD